MGFELPSLPSFQTNIPQMPSALDQYGKMLQLKSLQGQQALQPGQVEQQQQQIQAQGMENQQRQLELQSQKAMMKAWSDPKFLEKFTGNDKAQSSGLGFDPDGLSSSLISQGVLPKDAMAMTNQFVERSQKIATTQKDIAQTGEAQAATRDKGYKVIADQIGGILDAPVAKAGDQLAMFKQDLVKNPQKYAGVPQEDLAHLFSADLEHLPAMATLIGLDGKIADFHKSKSEAASAAQKVIPEGGGMSPEMQAEGNKQLAVSKAEQPIKIATELAVAKAEQPLKIQTAEAEGKARQLMQGLAEPVYAMDAQGNKVLTSKTTALQSGAATILPVTEKQVGDDTMLINRLGDVRQKLTRYEQAMQQPVAEKDKGNMAALLDKQNLRVGAFGTEFPVARFESALQKENLDNLSPAARDQLVAYRNMREALVGYNRVLSGSARGGEKQFEVQEQTIPDPSIADQDFANRSFRDFRENLGVVGQGLPKIPGVKSPDEIEQQITGKGGASAQAVKTKAAKWGVPIP